MMENRKNALVTGGSRGIGAACAIKFREEGYSVTINYNKSEDTAKKLCDNYGISAVKFDVADSAAVNTAFDAISSPDVLVVNAGIALQKLFTDTTPDEWRRIFAVNVDGAYNVCRRAIPHMVHEKWGRIVIMSSMWGIRGASCEVAYSASKAALIGMTKALAKELGPSGITVNCIAPGVIDTDMNANLSPDVLSELADETPLCRLGEPRDVAELVSFLASDGAAFITGQVISADGGFAI
jgi:3-oxoacyl-[acyl-carrier protein] reductase